jgi:hypothetical protein
VDVDDPASICVEERVRVDAVVARVDDELDSVPLEEVAHGHITMFF